jgi:protein-disulfide isomerase
MHRELTSAAVPPIGPTDHVRGEGVEAIVYLDLACPQCAAAWLRVRELPLRLCVRHFPLTAKRPRSPALHAAAEAAALQREDAFWALVDSIYADHGHQDDPHLWERARALGLDLERFERDRRSPEIAARVRADFESGIRGGVVATPTAFASGERLDGDVGRQLAGLTAR